MSPIFCFFAILMQHGNSLGATADESRVSVRNLTDAQIANKRQGIVNLKKYIGTLAVVEHHVAPVTTLEGLKLSTTVHLQLILASVLSFFHLNLTVQLENQSFSGKVRKSEWEMINHSLEYVNGIPFLRVKLRRKDTFYTVCLVVPMVLTSCMNTLVFLVPLEAGEKVSFLVSIFISTSVFTSFFTSVMPRGLEVVPASMKLLVGVTTESLVLLVCTLLVMWRYHSARASHHGSGASPHQPSDRPHTDHSNKADRGGRQWCCSSQKGLGEVRVGPESEEGQEERVSDEKEHEGCVWSSLPALTPQLLDRLFFLVSFVVNTVFLCIILYD